MADAEQARIAQELYERLGRADNILQATNCMTRLRVRLVRKDAALVAAVKGVKGVIGALDVGDEFQIVLGPGRVQAVADEVRSFMAADRAAAKKKSGANVEVEALREAIKAKNATPVKLFFRRIASIFVPLIPGFIACGLITGILGVYLKLAPEAANAPLVKLLAVFGNAVFWGMNLFVGWSAAQVFGGTPILGGVLAAVISHPGLANVTLSDAPLLPGRGGVISVVLAAGMGVWLEKRLHRVVPEIFDLFLTPLLTVLLAGAATVLVVQPLGGVLSDWIGRTAMAAVGSGGAVTGFVLGGLWLPMVMLGIHQAMTPIHVDLIARYGVTVLLPILAGVLGLPDEDDVLPRLDDHHEGDGHRQAGGLIGRPVGLQGVILRAQHHLPDPAAVEGREIGKADLDPDLLRRFQDPCQQIPGFTHSCVSSFSFSLARVSTAII